MIVQALFSLSVTIMIVTFLVGNINFIFLSTLATLILMSFIINHNQNFISRNTNQKSKKTYNPKCFHTNFDCEGCLSQTNCTSKKENILVNKQDAVSQ